MFDGAIILEEGTMFKDFYDDKTEPIVVQALCDFYGLTADKE